MSSSPPSARNPESEADVPPCAAIWTPKLRLFDHACVQIQQESEELVVFCPLLRLPVIIAWPTVNGLIVPYELLLPFLRRNELHWACFCALNLENSESISCAILHYSGKGTYAVCHYTPPRCSFFINLGRKSETATLRAEYAPVSANTEYDSQTLLGYLISKEERPYIEGYWGERYSHLQEGRLMLVSDEPSEALGFPDEGALQMLAPAISPSPALPPAHLNQLNLPEAALFVTLGQGAGITLEDIEGLLSRCPPLSTFFRGASSS
ncbi:hypothetical protein C8J57DRAFT_1507216 [Mycena rebaudengoi]|nr:hypothetical protein C8J57DRAFT_1507216 [Mycena rebaudengoi]